MNTIALKIWDWLGSTPTSSAPKEKEAKQLYPYRFNFLLAGLFIVAVALLVGFSYRVASAPSVSIRKVVEQIELETVADLQRELGAAGATGTGAQVAPELAKVCTSIDVYQKEDGYVLICRP